jgi:hypothetical protein
MGYKTFITPKKINFLPWNIPAKFCGGQCLQEFFGCIAAGESYSKPAFRFDSIMTGCNKKMGSSNTHCFMILPNYFVW